MTIANKALAKRRQASLYHTEMLGTKRVQGSGCGPYHERLQSRPDDVS